ncbi:MAG: formate dehydrogenase accessory sulfurtransferase FdhD [Gammaproteobacteria bacterium]|nr:formate dehydrogenase accessory sulfurtransferase FdhD [Gammaproteobacteria bacterium]MDE0257914.1 formate dehydrogenase accessory sulfurtransferase FdhD [Gammaproteobacteria bacterium]
MIVPRRRITRLRVTRLRDRDRTMRQDVVAVEEPLEIRVRFAEGDEWQTRSVSVTMRTPGDDFELAAGFLFAEGLVSDRRDVHEISYCTGDEQQEYNLLEVRLAPDASFDAGLLNRNFYMTSSCGVCGKASLEAIEVQGCAPVADGTLSVRADVLKGLPDSLRAAQPVFEKTGGIHASGLFDRDGALLALREDVGRHNALDKLIGREFLAGRLPLADRIVLVSGRTSFELMQKATMAGVPVVAAVGAPSSLAVELARRFNVTLVGFTRATGFNVYAGRARVRT